MAVGLIALVCLQTGCSTKRNPSDTKPTPKTSVKASQRARPKNRYGFNRVLNYGTTKVEFGELVGSDIAERSLTVKNQGSEAVVVSNILTSCPCCQAMLSDLEIPAGGQTKLNIALDPTKATERFSVLVSVEYMDREEVDRVQIVGQVVK